MKYIKFITVIFLCGWLMSCNKTGSSTPASTMSASVNGAGNISFTASFTNTNGIISMIGTSSTYTIQLVMRLSGTGGTFYLADPSTGYYAVVSDNFGNKYTTTASSTGQAVVTPASSGSLYNGSFYFTAYETTPIAGSVTVNSGQFTNM